MSNSSNELVHASQTVSAVVKGNATATEQMTASSAEFDQAIQHIAAVSQQSGDAIQEVALATDAIRHQVNDVAVSARAATRIAGMLGEILSTFRMETGRYTAA